MIFVDNTEVQQYFWEVPVLQEETETGVTGRVPDRTSSRTGKYDEKSSQC